jgi:hypothetical protein
MRAPLIITEPGRRSVALKNFAGGTVRCNGIDICPIHLLVARKGDDTMRTTIWTLVLSLALVSAAGAAPTDEEKCQAAKLNAVRKRTFCIEGERRKEVLGMTPDVAKCEEKFDKAIMMADTAAAKKGASCRWLDNADSTATDLNTGLQWALKTDDGSAHDKDNTYTWTTTLGGTTPNGTAFTDHLGTLNGGVSADGSTTTGCFSGHCDWRLPTTGELRGIVDLSVGPPLTTIPGFTALSHYWSSTTLDVAATHAWWSHFNTGTTAVGTKPTPHSVRAVRTDS